MDLNETREILEKFAKYVVKQARTNLTKQGKNTSKNLYNSIKYIPKDDGLRILFEIELIMENSKIKELEVKTLIMQTKLQQKALINLVQVALQVKEINLEKV